jgi:hypothetical protein
MNRIVISQSQISSEVAFGSTASSSVQVGKVLPVARSLWAISPVTVGTVASVRHDSGSAGTAQYSIVWLCQQGVYCSATTAYSWVKPVNLG